MYGSATIACAHLDEAGCRLRAFSARIHDADIALFARIAIRADEPPRVLPPRDGVFLKNRLRRAIGAEYA